MEIDAELINSLVNKKIDDAKKIALGIVEKIKFKNVAKRSHLIHDIEKTPTSNEICQHHVFHGAGWRGSFGNRIGMAEKI